MVSAAALPAAGDETAAHIDAYLAPLVAAGHVSGSILVVKGDEVLYENSFGLANREHDIAVGPDSRFCIASISKPMTQVIALRLVGAGTLALGDPISKWLPDFPKAGEITVEMLLRHQAGIPHRVTTELEESAPRTAADMVEFASKKDLLFEPGAGETYSSGGYSVLVRVLELASGKGYVELLQEHVLGPAGMTESIHPGGHNLIDSRASSYQFTAQGELVNSPLKNYSFLVGAGSIFSTAGDLVRLMKAAVSGTFGEPATGVLMRNGGLAWNGRTGGYRAFADFHEDADLYIGFVSNILTGAGDLIRRDLPLIVAGEDVAMPVVPRHEPVEVAAATLASYEGDYELRPGSTLTMSVENGAVSMSGWLLIPTSETSFFSPQDYGEIKVVKGEDGAVERLDWIVAGEAYPMPKVDTPRD